MPKLVVICGQKNSGKTSYVCALVKELTKQGLRVGTLKHTHHRHDIEGKDSDRHQVAGAEKVLLVSPMGLAAYETYKDEPTIEELITAHFSTYDFVLAEGYRSTDYSKIIVGDDPGASLENRIANVPSVLDGKVSPDIISDLVRVLGS